MDWRTILAEIIEDPAVKKKLAEEMHLRSSRTLSRWVDGTNPQNFQQIQRLALVGGRYHSGLEEALTVAFPAAFKGSSQYQVLEQITQDFFSQILGAYATLQRNLKHYGIKNLVFLQMVRHLDAQALGFVAVFIQAVSEDGQQIHHFLAQDGAGNTVWDTRQVLCPPALLSLESLISRNILLGVPHYFQNDSPSHGLLPFLVKENELRSFALQPVRREGAIAGGLLCGAAQPDFFTSSRKDLLRQYADLFALAFSDNDFYRSPLG